MLQKIVQAYEWKNFRSKSENIDKLVQWAMQKENRRISNKYSNISNTVKILKNLMIEFTKKADNLQNNLLNLARVKQTQFQSSYYQKRINQCLELSQKLKGQIQNKNSILNKQQQQVNELRCHLMKLKTDNIKISMKMDQMEQKFSTEEEKQNYDANKERRKAKHQQIRSLIKNSNSKFYKNSLREQSIKLQLQLLNKIDKVHQLKRFIQESFATLRQKLKKQQKKSNLYGLAGSMLFKLESADDSFLPKTKKLGDSKLMIYDILKQKYKKHCKTQNKKEEQLVISLEEFLKFSPIQIMGVIQLKGGLKNIMTKKCELQNKQDLQFVKVQDNVNQKYGKLQSTLPQSILLN